MLGCLACVTMSRLQSLLPARIESTKEKGEFAVGGVLEIWQQKMQLICVNAFEFIQMFAMQLLNAERDDKMESEMLKNSAREQVKMEGQMMARKIESEKTFQTIYGLSMS